MDFIASTVANTRQTLVKHSTNTRQTLEYNDKNSTFRHSQIIKKVESQTGRSEQVLVDCFASIMRVSCFNLVRTGEFSNQVKEKRGHAVGRQRIFRLVT